MADVDKDGKISKEELTSFFDKMLDEMEEAKENLSQLDIPEAA